MKTRDILLILLIPMASCDNKSEIQDDRQSTPINEAVNNEENPHEKTDTTRIAEPSVKEESKPRNNQKDAVKPVETLEIPIDIDHPLDPFDDPNYIGTPCGDYDEEGNCRRHHHKDIKIRDEYDPHQDSLQNKLYSPF